MKTSDVKIIETVRPVAAFVWTQPVYTNCGNCGGYDHDKGNAPCPCGCHDKRRR